MMRRLVAFFGGLLSGGALGTVAALLFTPASGAAMRRSLRSRYDQAVLAGQVAGAQKRLELEAQLVEITAPHPAGSPLAATGSVAPPPRR